MSTHIVQNPIPEIKKRVTGQGPSPFALPTATGSLGMEPKLVNFWGAGRGDRRRPGPAEDHTGRPEPIQEFHGRRFSRKESNFQW